MKADPGRDGADVSPRIRLRALIVEDSEDDALLLLRELGKGGFEPEHERVDNPENMRRALAEGEPWDVVLSDWRMLRFSAPEALGMLRETDSEAPFVIVSGKVGEEAAVEAMKAGAHDYVMKGNLTRLCATVERGLREAEARRERRRAEEERDRLFEVSLDLLGVAGLDGYFKRVNPAFEGTLGYSSGELLARPLIEFVHPEDRAATVSELEGLGRGVRTAYFENRYLRKDGTVVWLEWKAVPVVKEDVIYATARDVTERKRVEEALRRRDAILRAVAFAAERFLEKVASWEESAPEVVERLGVAAEVSRVYIFENYRGEDGEVWSTQRYEWVAPGVSSQMDNPLMQAFPNRAAGYGRWMEMLTRGEPVHGHTRNFPAGEQPGLQEQDILSIAIVPIFVEGEWWGQIGFDECLVEREWSAAEIDALKAAADTLGAAIQRERAEEATRQSEQLYRTVVEQATEYISLVDVQTRRFVGSNRAFREALGYSEEELGHMTLYDIVAHDRESIDENARRVVERGRYSLGERKHRRKDGTLVDVEVNASTVLHDGREVACIVGHDVTERKRAEEEIKQERDFSSAITDTVGALVGVFDSEGRIVRFNRACERLSGYTFEEVRGRYFWELFLLPEEVESVKDVAGEITAGRFPNSNENYWKVRDGSLRLISWHNTALLDERGEVAYIIATGIDVTEQRRAEDELRESQRALATLMSNLPGMAYRCTNDPLWTMELVSAGCSELTGYPPEDIVDNRRRSYGDLIHPDDRDAVWESVQVALASPERPNFQFNYRIKTASGATKWVWEQGRGVFSPEGTLLALEGFVTDVTERKRARDALEESEERYRQLVELSPDSIMVHDGEKVLFSNAAGAELFGASSPEELAGKRVMDFVPPDYEERLRARIAGVKQRGERANLIEEKLLRLDGRTVDVEGVATPITYRGEAAVLAVARDITERKQAKDALAQSEERYRAVVEQAAEGIFLFDAATGDVLESNAAFGELLGYTVAELLEMRIYDFVAHDRESIDSNVQSILDEGGRFVGERRYRRKDGSLAEVALSANPISYDGREVICAVIRDITERVEAFRMMEERVTALAGISASLTVDRPMETTLNALAAGIVEGTAAVACSVVLIDPRTSMIRLAGSRGLPEGYTDAMQASWRGGVHSRMVRVFRSQRPSLGHNARRVILDNPLYAPLHPLIREVRWDTVYIVPLVARGEALGALNLYYLPGQEPGEDETVFLKAVADQTAVAVDNASLFAAAQGKAALEERQRLARELHDSVSQALYGIGLGSRTARTLLEREGSPERVDEWLEYVLSLAEAGLTEMRALIFELRPESLETEGLVAALKQQAAALEARHEIPVHTTLGEEPDLPLETKEALYRIAQEALHNTFKHARASRANLKLECDARGIALEVSDDGAGFDPGGDFSGHLGLKSMRERAARLGGTLRVESTPGEGTSIRVRIPPGT